MEIQDFDSGVVRRILAGLMVDLSFVSSVAASGLSGLFDTVEANIIADVCINFYVLYKRPVGDDIQVALSAEVERRQLNQGQIDLLQSLLVSLELESQRIRGDDVYLFKVANDFFNSQQLRRSVDRVVTKLSGGDVSSAILDLHKFRQIELGVNYGIDPLKDESAIRLAFSATSEQLIKFGSKNVNMEDASLFFGDIFSRDNLVAFLAPEKMGKCVKGDALVYFADGSMYPVREVVRQRINKKVISYNEITQNFVEADIDEYWDNGDKQCIQVTTKSGRKVTTTANHKYLTPDGWKQLDSLEVGDFIAVPKKLDFFGASNILWDEVVLIESVGVFDTYDLTIKTHHNFVADGVVVHNTFMLLDVAWRAVLQRRRVAFFEIGDMSQNQIMLRLMQRVTKRPRRRGYYSFPTCLEVDRKRNVITDPVQEYFEFGLDVEDALSACNELAIDRGLLRLSVHANSTVSVLTLESVLDSWERVGWTPDVIVIDYADLLIPVDSRLEKRHQVDETWRRLRGLSQVRHCLIITATQADAASYKTKVLDKSNFSESKTKLAHATGIIGINATPQERDQSVRRLNWIVRREGSYNELDMLYIAGSLAVACPMQFSKLG
ncbi:MAG: hypothetical protein LBP59_10440 [Planctomycetaceae bacterium]|jgi:hypothetical protein|nr:hypothetical protein [Planctomycetaceae bacterium]